jgi:hypothetical protein
VLVLILLGAAFAAYAVWAHARFERSFDAEYVTSEVCAECHTLVHAQWEVSPHANIVRPPDSVSVVGNFRDGAFRLPADSPDPRAGEVVAKAYQRDGRYIFALAHPSEERFVEFPIELVVGYQYRQEYLYREPGGVLRRLPLQWSTATASFFPYWNVQEGSAQTVADLWSQMTVPNSAWNLFCARCHTTHLEIVQKNPQHTIASVKWAERGIACEACHGPGSLHAAYMRESAVNRLGMFMRNTLAGEPVAYIASAPKLDKGPAVSVCGRCHGADIFARNQDMYRLFEPGWSREGRINDLSGFFHQAPLTPGRTDPTVEVWHDGRPKGIGMLFRSFVESACYADAQVRCYDCHNPHDNKREASPGLLSASPQSDAWCLSCHARIAADVPAHTRHGQDKEGAHCYDCHMPWHISKIARGVQEWARSHEMSSIPNPQDSLRHGLDKAPNACNSCHRDRDPAWAVQKLDALWPGASGRKPRYQQPTGVDAATTIDARHSRGGAEQ